MRQYRQTAPVTQATDKLLSWIPPASLVLDVGPGNGEDARLLASAGHRVIGIDVRNDLVTPDGWELRIGSASDMTVPDGYADVILGNRLIHHLRDPLAFLTEAHRALRDDGLLLLAWPDHYELETSHEAATRAFRAVLTAPGAYLANPLSLEQGRNLVESHGFSIVQSGHETAQIRGAAGMLYALPEPDVLRDALVRDHPTLVGDADALLSELNRNQGWVRQSIAVLQVRKKTSQ